MHLANEDHLQDEEISEKEKRDIYKFYEDESEFLEYVGTYNNDEENPHAPSKPMYLRGGEDDV